MSWPRQGLPQQGPPVQDEVARRILEDASQQLRNGKPSQSLQVRLLSPHGCYCPPAPATPSLNVLLTSNSVHVLQTVLSLLSALNLPEEAAAVAIK